MQSSTQILASWLVGSDASCDIVVNHPTVSGHHCRLTQYERQFTLEDMGSTNGTFVDAIRLTPRIPVIVSREQQIMMGRIVALPWPGQIPSMATTAVATAVTTAPSPMPSAAHPTATRPPRDPRVILIGRSPDSDIVLDYPVISWEHARIVERNGQHILEDLNSRNGVAINQLQNRVTEAALQPDDDVYLGSFKIPASRLIDRRTAVGEANYQPVSFTRDSIVIGRDPTCEQPIDNAMISWHHARLSRTPEGIFVEDLGSLNGTFVAGTRISGRVKIAPGQEVALGSFRFQLLEGGALQRREYHGNVSIQAADVVVNAPNGTRLLDPVSLTVYPSELVALMGPAGAGKTTFLKTLNGYTRPAQGQVLFNGADLYQHPLVPRRVRVGHGDQGARDETADVSLPGDGRTEREADHEVEGDQDNYSTGVQPQPPGHYEIGAEQAEYRT